MPKSISNIAPQTLAEWNELCENTHFNAVEAYDNAVAEAKANAEAQWDAEYASKREELIAQLEANLNAQLTADPATGDLVSLPKDEWDTKYEAGIAEIDAELARQKQEAIDHSIMGIQQPDTLEQIQAMYSFMKPQEQASIPEPEPQGFSYDAFYRLADGRIYSVGQAQFVKSRDDIKAIDVPGGTPDDLKELLIFYRDKKDGYSKVKIGYELLTLDEAKAAKIDEVNAQTSANIEAGFAYSLTFGKNTETVYFSMNEKDQLNFANMANAARMLIDAGSDTTIEWQGWATPYHAEPMLIEFSPQKFLDLYTNGALKHLNDCLDQGRKIKETVRAAKGVEAVATIGLSYTAIAAMEK